jgi:hypothetical protein
MDNNRRSLSEEEEVQHQEAVRRAVEDSRCTFALIAAGVYDDDIDEEEKLRRAASVGLPAKPLTFFALAEHLHWEESPNVERLLKLLSRAAATEEWLAIIFGRVNPEGVMQFAVVRTAEGFAPFNLPAVSRQGVSFSGPVASAASHAVWHRYPKSCAGKAPLKTHDGKASVALDLEVGEQIICLIVTDKANMEELSYYRY